MKLQVPLRKSCPSSSPPPPPPQGKQEFRLDPMLDDHEVNMEKMNTWNFQIFDLVDITGGRTGRILSHVSPYQCCPCRRPGRRCSSCGFLFVSLAKALSAKMHSWPANGIERVSVANVKAQYFGICRLFFFCVSTGNVHALSGHVSV